LSVRGAKLPGKLLELRDTWCPNNGSSTPPHRALRLTITGALTLSSMVPHHWVDGGALCCDATLVATQDGAGLRTACRRKHATYLQYPELAAGGAQTLCIVLGCEVGARWNDDAVQLVRRLVALRAHRAPPAVRAPAKAAWARHWWSVLSVAVQQAVGYTAPMPGPAHSDAPALDEVLDLADPDGPSRLPLRFLGPGAGPSCS